MTAKNRASSALSDAASRWFDELDEQPGLEAQLWRWSHGQQLATLPPELEREVQLREAKRAARAR